VSGVVTATNFDATSNITVGDSFINPTSIGIGTTTTAGRNAGVGTAVGTLIYNSTVNAVEVYTGSAWAQVTVAFTATGGTLDSSSRPGYNVHTFTGDGSFTVSAGNKTIEYLVVAGGGAGGKGTFNGTGFETGGGGAGGYRTGSFTINPGTYPIQVGGGGANSPYAHPGNPSYISGPGISSITSTGGGAGGGNATGKQGEPGGSGGGGSYPAPAPGGTGNAGGYSPVEGYPGGNGNNSPNSGGGGGGASEAGESPPAGGRGGDGLPSSITGSSITRGGGGGGGASPVGTGGAGGGANKGTSDPGPAGTANTGGGGGGISGGPGYRGGQGGSGIVIIAYPTA
jgi:hypothetical protein